jgi:hypothetical protein
VRVVEGLMAGDLIRPDGQLVNGSRSQRQIAFLEARVLGLNEQVEHLKAMLAVLTYNAGGTVRIEMKALRESYKLEATPTDDEAIVWTVKKKSPLELDANTT